MDYLTAIIAFLGVLIGALISGGFSVWIVKKNHKNCLKSALLEYRKDLYLEVINILVSSNIQIFQDYKTYHDEVIRRKSGDISYNIKSLIREPFTDVLGNSWSDNRLHEHLDIICSNAKDKYETMLEQLKSLSNRLQLFSSDSVYQQVKEYQKFWIKSYDRIILQDSMTSSEISKLYRKQKTTIKTMSQEFLK